MQLKWYHAAILVVTALATLLFWSFSRGTQPNAATQGAYHSFSRFGSQGFATPAELERMLNRNPSHKAMLEAYRLHAQYPDFSRPLEKSMVDLIDPWKHVDEPMPLIDDPAAIDALCDQVAGASALRLLGVMGVPPLEADPDAAFARLSAEHRRVLRGHPEATGLSAGMSSDLEVAVKHGSTCVRVGTALLGRRPLTSP